MKPQGWRLTRKSFAHGLTNRHNKPTWLASYDWKWPKEGGLSKPIGIPFGLNLNTHDVDQFFCKIKISNKLDYWSTMNSSWHVDLSFAIMLCYPPCGFFITVWGGSNKILGKVGGTIHNYLLVWQKKNSLNLR